MTGWKFHVISILIFTVLLSASATLGADSGRISIQPKQADDSNPLTKSWFIYSLKPGSIKNDTVRLFNNTSEFIKVKLYAGDARTVSNGGFGLTQDGENISGLGSWIQLSLNEIVLNPHQYRDIDFIIAIPADVVVGDHAGGIIIQEVEPQKSSQHGMRVNIISRVGVRIYQTVEGDKKYDLVLQKVRKFIQDNTFFIGFSLKNRGNVTLQPKGYIYLKSLITRKVTRVQEDDLGSILPDQTASHNIKILKIPFIIDIYKTSVWIEYTPTKVTSKDQVIVVINSKYIAYIGGLCFIIIGSGIVFRRYKKKKTLTFAKKGYNRA